jgi:hypothetical protein
MITPKNYYGWDGFCIAAGDIELGITPSIGGRIISLQFKGKELFYVDSETAGKQLNLLIIDDLKTKKRELGFPLWGGDKTWPAPQREWIELSPPLDLDSAPYSFELSDNAIEMTSPICRETGLRIIRRTELKNDGAIILDQTLINESDKIKHCAIWNVTQLLKPFEIYLPCSTKAIHYDPRFEAGKFLRHQFVKKIDDHHSKIICKDPVIFKYGCRITEGKVIAISNDICMTKTFDIFPNEDYTDGHMVEVFNSSEKNYLELEVLSPLKTLHPGERISHQQIWEICRGAPMCAPF